MKRRLARFSSAALLLVPVIVMAWFVCAPAAAGKQDKSHVVPLPQAHAHNDYEHKRPLQDALEHGFCSVEADVFLVDGQMLVGHDRKDLRPGRTLERLYLEPLRERVRLNGGRIYPGGPAIFLLIDVKTEAKTTYTALAKILARYDDILSMTRQGKFEPRAVTAVISGNRAQEAIAAEKVRYAGIDGRQTDLESTAPADLMPWISANWALAFGWRGDGPMPAEVRGKLEGYVRKAHARGRLVRFWGTPETPAFWKELCVAKVDLINTDKLDELQGFLLSRLPGGQKP